MTRSSSGLAVSLLKDIRPFVRQAKSKAAGALVLLVDTVWESLPVSRFL